MKPDLFAMTQSNRARPEELVRNALVRAARLIQQGDIDEALNILERTVNVCESHPSFAKPAAAQFQNVARMLAICYMGHRAIGKDGDRADDLLRRMRSLRTRERLS
jgi:hypothetical protein